MPRLILIQDLVNVLMIYSFVIPIDIESELEPVFSNVLETFYNIKIFIKFEHIPGTRTMVLMSRKNYLMTLIYRILNL